MNEENKIEKSSTEYYVQDTFSLLKEEAKAAKAQRDNNVNTSEYQFYLGYLTALSDVISLLQSQAFVFNIHLSELGLDDIDPEKDLL